MKRLSGTRLSVLNCLFLMLFFLPSNVIIVVFVNGVEPGHTDDELVRQVLDEQQDDAASNPYDNAHSTEEDFQRYQQELNRRKLEEEQQQKRLAQETAHRRALEREAEVERQVQKLSLEEQKKARQKKQKDATLVSNVLKAFKRGDYYSVLGLGKKYWIRQWLPEWMRRGRYEWWEISLGDIKKAYRFMATRIHPDKNMDGRAEEAFVALDEAYDCLANPLQRQEYDGLLSERVREQWQRQTAQVQKIWTGLQVLVRQVKGVIRKVLGPFAMPLMILGFVFL